MNTVPSIKDTPTVSTDNDHNKTPQNKENVNTIRNKLLDWYDTHRRVLPWRSLPSQTPDPYHIWLSEVMLQQTVVNAVIPYFQKFVEKWPTVNDLASAEQNEVMESWAGLGYYSRARNLHKCANIIVADYQGDFPDNQKALKNLPGIGDYTSAAITAIAFNKPATVVDGNVERVIARLYSITEPLPNSKKQLKNLTNSFYNVYEERPGDLAQAMMDLGATICIPKAPRCILCPIRAECSAQKERIAEQLPAKILKKPKPQKHGYIYLIRNRKGEVLLQRRPEKGMLGGMLGFPTSNWIAQTNKKEHAPFIKNLTLPSIIIHEEWLILHSFTHFDLKLIGCFIDKEYDLPDKENDFFWVKEKDITPDNFPTLFKKFIKFALV